MTTPCSSRPDRSVSALDFVAMVQPDRDKEAEKRSVAYQRALRAGLKEPLVAHDERNSHGQLCRVYREAPRRD